MNRRQPNFFHPMGSDVLKGHSFSCAEKANKINSALAAEG